MTELKKTKIYSVKDCSDLLDLNEQTTRRYIDDFKLGTRENSTNGVERRILNEDDFNRLSEIIELKKKGFTPKTIGLILSADLTVVPKNHLDLIEQNMKKAFEEYGKNYLEMQQRIEKLELQNQKMIEVKEEKPEEKNDELEELKQTVQKLQKRLDENEEKKNEPVGSKKSIWQKIFG